MPRPQEAPLEARRAAAMNECRQALAVRRIADEHLELRGGIAGFMAGTPWVCKAVAVDLEQPLDKAAVAELVAWFEARGARPLVEVTSFSAPRTFASLAEAGLSLVETEHVFVCRLPGPERPLPAGYTIRTLDVDDEAAMQRHAEIVCSGFHPDPDTRPPGVIESAKRGQRQYGAQGFFVLDPEGDPVAASGMEITTFEHAVLEGPRTLAALWGTTVLPDHRGVGLQQALMAHRLRVGAAGGARVAFIESQPGIPTARNAVRLGFTLGYTRLVFRAKRNAPRTEPSVS